MKKFLLLEIYRTGTPVSRFYQVFLGRVFVFIGIGLLLVLNYLYAGNSAVVSVIGILAICILSLWCVRVIVQKMNAAEAFNFLAQYLFADRIEFLKKVHPELLNNLQKEFETHGEKNQPFDDTKPGNC